MQIGPGFVPGLFYVEKGIFRWVGYFPHCIGRLHTTFRKRPPLLPTSDRDSQTQVAGSPGSAAVAGKAIAGIPTAYAMSPLVLSTACMIRSSTVSHGDKDLGA